MGLTITLKSFADPQQAEGVDTSIQSGVGTDWGKQLNDSSIMPVSKSSRHGTSIDSV